MRVGFSFPLFEEIRKAIRSLEISLAEIVTLLFIMQFYFVQLMVEIF